MPSEDDSYQEKGKDVPLLNQLSTTQRRHMGERRRDPYFIDLGTCWRSVVSFTSLAKLITSCVILDDSR
jgi:hypothetical protein